MTNLEDTPMCTMQTLNRSGGILVVLAAMGLRLSICLTHLRSQANA